MFYKEEDTKLHYITPALQSDGWIWDRITMEYPEELEVSLLALLEKAFRGEQ